MTGKAFINRFRRVCLTRAVARAWLVSGARVGPGLEVYCCFNNTIHSHKKQILFGKILSIYLKDNFYLSKRAV